MKVNILTHMHMIKLLHSIPNYVLKFCFETISRNFCCFSFLARKIFVKMLSMHSRPYNANNSSLSVPRTKMHGPNDRNIVARNMLRAFGHPVARCCEMLGVGSNLKIAKFFMQHLWMLLDTVVVWAGFVQQCCTRRACALV